MFVYPNETIFNCSTPTPKHVSLKCPISSQICMLSTDFYVFYLTMHIGTLKVQIFYFEDKLFKF